MNFDNFKNSLFYESACIRIDPITLDKFISYPVFIHGNITESSEFDDMNSYMSDINPDINCIRINFEQAIRMTILPNTKKTNKIWLPEEFRIELLRQYHEYSKLRKIVTDNNLNAKVLRNLFIITPPDTDLRNHHHFFKGSTFGICYKFNVDDTAEPSYIKFPRENANVIVPDTDKFYYHFKNNPMHGVHSNHWLFWWLTDFVDSISVPKFDFYELESPYFTNATNNYGQS
jgi:hypothetical protein